MACPCGSTLRPGLDAIDYLDQAALDALVPALEVDMWAPILSWLLGTAVDLRVLCASPPPPYQVPEANWFTNPIVYVAELLNLVNAVRWPLLCACTACPPVSDCAGGVSYTIGQPDAYFESSSCYAYKFHLTDADVYAQASGCSCAGNFTGDVFVQFNPAQDELIPNPKYPGEGPEFIGGCGGVTDRTIEITGSGAGQYAVCNEGDVYGTVTIWQNGGGGEPSPPWPELPTTVEPFPPTPACTEEAQCDAIDYLGRTVTELIWQTALIAQRTSGIETDVTAITGPYSITVPGVTGPISGTLSEVLPRLFVALAPPTQAQLTQEFLEPVTGSGTVDLTGIAVVEVTLTTVPANLVPYGTTQRVYHHLMGARAPGWVTVRSLNGVLSRHWIDYDNTTVIQIPPLAVDLTYQLEPGVEVSVYGFSRTIA